MSAGNEPEVWASILGYECAYEVSSLGVVRSVDRTLTLTSGLTRNYRGRVLSTVVNSKGYVAVHLQMPGRRPITRQIHRLVAEAFWGPCPKGMETAHNDGNGSNNRLSNLRFATHKDNEADKVVHGITNRGEAHGNAKLTCRQVYGIRLMLDQGKTQKAIAGIYGVSRQQIGKIARGEQRQHPCTNPSHTWHATGSSEVAA